MMGVRNLIVFTVAVLSGWQVNGFAGDTARNVRPRVGLVLSGGGAKGFAHVGVLKVLEEVGMPVDYIGGTSIGSIVGGLYSLGYTAEQLETYIREKDWNNLLYDKVPRKNIVIQEKEEHEKYWLQFPFSWQKLDLLPKSLLSGQNVSNLFAELTSPAYRQKDFSRFPIPFFCIATDLHTGAEVMLEHGELSRAMRASMAIPSVFAPEKIDGRVLVDGGLVNNLPADRLKEKGMDILIGVDVTSRNDSIIEPDNLYRIMERVVFMSALPLKNANRKLCRILIVPDITGYRATSFNAVDSLILNGEKAARAHYSSLKSLADSLNRLDPPETRRHADCPQPLPVFHVKNIVMTGLVNTSRQYVLRKSELSENAELTFDELNKAVERLKGAQFFESVVYRLNRSPEDEHAVDLHLDFVEHATNFFRVGLHYDKEYKPALLLNLSVRNVLLNNSRAVMDLSVGENPAFMLTYFHSPGMQPLGKTLFKSSLSPEWLFHINAYQRSYYNYSGNRGNQRTELFDCTDIIPSVKMQITPSINSMVGAGLSAEYLSIRSRLVQEDLIAKISYMFLSYQFYYERDTYNEDYFPTDGCFLRLEGNYHKGMSKNVRFSGILLGAMLRSNFAVALTSRWTVHSGVDAASVAGTDVSPQYHVYAGGFPDKLYRYEFRFPGVHFMQLYAKNMVSVHFNHQVRMWSNIYVTFRTGIGKMEDDWINLFAPRDFLLGYGASVQYNSIVGPMGFTLSSSNVTNSLLGAFHVGFWF
ncbi:MAG: patatin-like phospholipase family protein [Bacteroidales bacterium]|jgi:NTE family protein|nr:patatin-like phospholipase family protein [Bacteroidales bacterium]